MQIVGREVGWTSLLAIAAAAVGVLGTSVFEWEFGDGMANPIAVGIGLILAGAAIWVSYIRA